MYAKSQGGPNKTRRMRGGPSLRGTAAVSNLLLRAEGNKTQLHGSAACKRGRRGWGWWCSLRPTHSTLRKKYFVCLCPGSTHTHTCTDTHVKTQTTHALNRGTVHTPIPRRRRTLAKRKKEKKRQDPSQCCAPRRNTAVVARPRGGSLARCGAAGVYTSPLPPPARPHLRILDIEKNTKKNAVLCPAGSKYWTHSCS